MSDLRPVYPSEEAVLRRIEVLKRHGIWPGYIQVPGGYQLLYDPEVVT